MQLSMTLPTMVPHGRDELLRWCRGIDEGPWAGLAVPERVTYPSHDLVVQLSAAAALTERVRLWTTIVILPAHDAVAMAKALASVDVVSAGRLTVGIGVGGREHDYQAIGAPFDHRWQRMDDQVATMRRIWAGEPPFEGADPVGPPPVQAGGPPLVAGVLGPKAIARAAKWAIGVDGPWTIDGDTRWVGQAAESVREAWAAAGRDEPPHLSTSMWFALGDGAEERLHDYVFRYMRIFGDEVGTRSASRAVAHSPQAVRDVLSACEEAGMDEVFLVPTSADPDELRRAEDAIHG